MWTNVFRIRGLHLVSWFQFLPNESDLSSLPDKRWDSVKVDQKDAAMWLVFSSHLQLQKDGFLSTWTNSFVGPWDPSQGLHNPDEKVKLWLFLPGRHSSVSEKAQPAVSRLRVVASGVWEAPGDSEEVATAFSQSLRNYIEGALMGLSYARFGDVFLKNHPPQSEGLFRRGQPTVEFIFAASAEAIFVHVIITAKHIRALSSNDMERVLKHSKNSSYKLPVIVSPHGMRGSLTGCCPTDLVKQVYLSSGKFKTNGFIGLQNHVSKGSGCQLRGQNCFVEVTLGCPSLEREKVSKSSLSSVKDLHKNVMETPVEGRGDQKASSDYPLTHEKTFIYPSEAVVVPVLQTSFARSSLKRFWLQNWIGPSFPGSSFFMHCGGGTDIVEGSWMESNGIPTQHGYNSSSNSNGSSISSISSSLSDSDRKMTTEAGDLEADGDSLLCRQPGLTSNDQLENGGPKLGLKRSRTGMTDSYGHMNIVNNTSVQDAYKSGFGSDEVNNSVIMGVGNEQTGSRWDWDDDDRGGGMDIQALLSEFGDFGDFFENDILPFGEPPGTAESEALMLSAPDCGEVANSPIGMMDVADQMMLPVGFPSFESINPSPTTGVDEFAINSQDAPLSSLTSALVDYAPQSSISEFDHLIKAEAVMTFAPEFGAVENPTNEIFESIFKRPYCPKSHKLDSSISSPNSYTYCATPPTPPCIDGTDERNCLHLNLKTGSGRHGNKKYYTHLESGEERCDKKSLTCNNSQPTRVGMVASPFSAKNSTNVVKSAQRKLAEAITGAENILFTMKTVVAAEVECILFQASMCRTRHTLLPSVSLSRLSGNTHCLNQLPGDVSTLADNISNRYEVEKKECIPVRIAGSMEGGLIDGHLSAPVGVWRSVAVPKVPKPTSSPSIESNQYMPHNSFNEDGIPYYGQRQHLQELLDSMTLLVQQATSFVDMALDADCGDGPYGWLALQEHWRRGFSCGPAMVHAGCGGMLASCHSLDIAGIELVDPLSADIHASAVISLLQSEMRTALKTAFVNLDGPLSVTDWCKGRNQLSDGTSISDGSCMESNLSECKDSLSTVTLCVGEPMSPAQSSASGSSSLKLDETCPRRSNQEIESEQLLSSRLKPTLFVLPSPAILVGYQDDWLKTSPSSLQFWEKAPFEPYALPKPITYYVICPDINPLTSAATDFFQQLGTVYETCKLGTHSPQSLGDQMDIDNGKPPSSGFVLVDCPQSMKIESSNASLVGSISDYFLSLSNGWNLTSYLKSLSKAIKSLKIGSSSSTSPKEGNSCPCLVLYVVCPFSEPTAVLKAVVESSVAAGSSISSSDREMMPFLLNQVGKALSCLAASDEASASNVLALPGFSLPKLVLQIVTVDAIFRVMTPALNELTILKETAFTVYNKARRITKGSSSDVQSASLPSRSHSILTQMPSVPAVWKDCVGPRIGGPSLPREAEIDASLRSGSWDNSWQTRTGGLSYDPNRNGDLLQDEIRYMFEPLFILSEPGSLENAVAPDDASGAFMQTGSMDAGSSSQVEGSELDGFGSGYQKTLPSLHCCYGWTEDWRWLVCIWTDARGELLDSHIFPFGGISSRQDTKGLQCLFVQILQQGCQILQACSSTDIGSARPRDFVIARIGNFFELEYLEWQKAIYSVGGSEMKKWPLQLRRSVPDGMATSGNSSSLQQQEMSLIQERNLPSSPNPLYSSHMKASGFMKAGLNQPGARKQLMSGHTVVDNSRGMLQWVQSISFVSISIDHSLHLMCQADSSSPGGAQGGNGVGATGYLEGFTPVKSLASTSASYILIPSPSMRFLPSTPLQVPTCLTADSPPLAHLLHSKGSAIPLSTGFVVSKSVPTMRKDIRSNFREEWPSVLSVSLIDYYGGPNTTRDKHFRGTAKQGGETLSSDAIDLEIESHLILETVGAELHALSWMTVSPAYLERRTALPFHCDMVLRLRRLLHFADKELSSRADRSLL